MKGIFKLDRDLLKGQNISVDIHYMGGHYRNHWHNYYEISYYDHCKGECVLNGQTYEIKGDCLFFLTPKDFHEIKPVRDRNAHSYIVGFTEHAPDKTILDQLNKSSIVLYDVPYELTSKIKEMAQISGSEKNFKELHLKNLLNCILIGILEKGATVPHLDESVSDTIRNSILYIMANPGKEITLKSMSAKAGLSPTYFSELFHKNTGITFKKYLTQTRIAYSKRLIEENKMSILEVGLESGFATHSQFVSAFKSITEMTPIEYKKKLKNSKV